MVIIRFLFGIYIIIIIVIIMLLYSRISNIICCIKIQNIDKQLVY